MGQKEDDLNRLCRVGDETSDANKKIIAAAVRLANKIAYAIPMEWVYRNDEGVKGQDLGDGYYVAWHGSEREFRYEPPGVNRMDPFTPHETTLAMARQFAGYVAGGWITRLLEKLEPYRTNTQNLLGVLEAGEKQLDATTQ